MGVKCIWVTKEELDKLHEEDDGMRAETYRYALTALELASV
jgi:hypothetical protein